MKTIAISFIVLCVVASAALVSAQNRNIVAHPVDRVPSGTRLTGPSLVDARIRFHTNDEDKDADTHVTVTVEDFNQVVAARVSNDFGHFDDQSDSGPFSLETLNASTKDDLQRGRLMIRIDPNGHDTWRFGFFIQLVFSDGITLAGSADGLELTQDRRQQTFGLQGILRTM